VTTLSHRASVPAGVVVRTAALVALRPGLWPTAVRQLWLLARPGWWRRPPYLPLPDTAYVEFRLHTAYGSGDRVPVGRDVVAWLRWCARMRGLTG
jgi:hypothetical protein